MTKKNIAIFTGPQKGLNIIGDHCYAYSGTVSVTGSETTMLDFTTGEQYLKVVIEPHGVFSQIGQSQISMAVTINGNTILHTYWDASLDSSMYDTPTLLLIPPLSTVTVTLAQATGSDKDMQLTLTGRVYR